MGHSGVGSGYLGTAPFSAWPDFWEGPVYRHLAGGLLWEVSEFRSTFLCLLVSHKRTLTQTVCSLIDVAGGG